MGTLVGHVMPGLLFVAIGFWHLFNHIKLYASNPNSYKSYLWFPVSKLKYFELFFIIVMGSFYISTELFLGPVRHQPFDLDGTIPSTHLHNFEHSLITLSIIVYAVFAIIFDKIDSKYDQCNLTQLVGTLAFGQELLIFHLHSTDHTGVEGQYHFMLQILITVSLVTTLTGIKYPNNFLLSFVRSASILAQGLWFVVLGYLIWTPELVPKGCFLHMEDAHQVLRCGSDAGLHRAKSLVNILFSFFLVGFTIFLVSFYLALFKLYSTEKMEYVSLAKGDQSEEDHDHSNSTKLRGGKNNTYGGLLGKQPDFAAFDLER